MLNAMSIDVEDWFHVYNMSDVIPRSKWDECESRVERNTRRLLELFARRNVRATFFTLGWVAERYPDLIREIDAAGHEIASHGYSHRLITQMTPAEFEGDLAQSLELLRPLATRGVRGFRAPSFSVTRATMWATDTMARLGLHYDSSVFPIGFHPDYGIGDAPLGAYSLPSGMTELPMSVVNVMGRRVPCSGGGYFRLLPYAMTRALIARCNAQKRPVVFYLHPWEIDPEQPRVKLPASKAFRHYNNLERTFGRLERLLADFRFGTVSDVLATQQDPKTRQPITRQECAQPNGRLTRGT